MSEQLNMSSTRRQFLTVLGVAALGIPLAACGSGDDGASGDSTTDGSPTGGSQPSGTSGGGSAGTGTAVMVIDADPATLSPALTTDYSTALSVAGKVFEGLVWLDPDGKPQPLLATKWEISDDQLTYTFHLRDGVTWHDGKPFTSADVKWSYETGLAKNARAEGALEHVKSIEAPDESTIIVKLTEAYAPFLSQMKVFDCPILPKHVYSEGDMATNPANQAPIGTGPFKFDSWEHGSSVTFVGYDGYWAKDEPKLGKLILQVIPDAAQRTSALTIGQADFVAAYYLATSDAAKLKADPNVGLHVVAAIPALDFMAMNEQNQYLAKKEVRQALAFAIDRKRIVEQAVAGLGVEGKGSFGNGFPWMYDEKVSYDKLYPYTPDKAKKMLAAAGVPDGTEFRLCYYANNAKFSAVAEIVKDNLTQVGLKVKLQPMDNAVFKETVYAKNDYDLMIQSFTSSGDPAIGYHRIYVTSKDHATNVNGTGYSNPKVDELLTKAGQVSDLDKRAEYYYQAQEILNVDVPTLILFDELQADAYRKDLHGLFAARNSEGQWGAVSISK